MTGFDYAYAAGLIDGEGTIGIALLKHGGKRTPQYVLRVQVANTDPRMPLWLKDRFGGQVYVDKRQQTHWKVATKWVIQSRQAADFLELIQSFLIVKADQAAIALAFQRTMGKKGRPVPATVGASREQMHAAMRERNRKGAA